MTPGLDLTRMATCTGRERPRSSIGGLTSGLAGEVDNHVTAKWCFKAENLRRKDSPGVPESQQIRNEKGQG